MKPAAYFSRITPISLHDPLAELLGATEDGIITYDFLDAVKLAGHACPTVAGAWLATVRGLRALYGDDMPVRGNVAVALHEAVDDGVAGRGKPLPDELSIGCRHDVFDRGRG